MIKSAASSLAVAILMTGLATPALAALEREDVLMLDADGHHYTRYQSLRSDSGEQILDLAPGETIADALFIVPSDYQQSKRADGGTRLQFAGGNYAIMTVGSFGERVHRTANGNYLFTSDNRIAGVTGHRDQSGAREDFASYAYSWFLPANIEILNYRADRSGEWRKQGNTLSWHGQYVKDVAFTIRYRVTEQKPTEQANSPAPVIAQRSESETPAAVAPPQPEPPKAAKTPPTTRQAPKPDVEPRTSPPATSVTEPAEPIGETSTLDTASAPSPKVEAPAPGLDLKTSPPATLVIKEAPVLDTDATSALPKSLEDAAPEQAPVPDIELETSPPATIVVKTPPKPDKDAALARSESQGKGAPLPMKAPAPGITLRTSPPATIVIDQRTRSTDASGREQAPPRSLSLANVVALADSGRPQITAHGEAVLGRLARTLAVNNARRIVVTGPSIADKRNTGGSVAQAARVADYLGKNGLASDRIDFRAGRMQNEHDRKKDDASNGPGVEITISPGNALGDFLTGDRF